MGKLSIIIKHLTRSLTSVLNILILANFQIAKDISVYIPCILWPNVYRTSCMYTIMSLCNCSCKEQETIAVLPIGYGDGYSKCLRHAHITTLKGEWRKINDPYLRELQTNTVWCYIFFVFFFQGAFVLSLAWYLWITSWLNSLPTTCILGSFVLWRMTTMTSHPLLL